MWVPDHSGHVSGLNAKYFTPWAFSLPLSTLLLWQVTSLNLDFIHSAFPIFWNLPVSLFLPTVTDAQHDRRSCGYCKFNLRSSCLYSQYFSHSGISSALNTLLLILQYLPPRLDDSLHPSRTHQSTHPLIQQAHWALSMFKTLSLGHTILGT